AARARPGSRGTQGCGSLASHEMCEHGGTPPEGANAGVGSRLAGARRRGDGPEWNGCHPRGADRRPDSPAPAPRRPHPPGRAPGGGARAPNGTDPPRGAPTGDLPPPPLPPDAGTAVGPTTYGPPP